MRTALAGLLMLALAGLAAGFAGFLHPAGDSLAVGRPVAALAAVVLGLVLAVAHRLRAGWFAAAIGALVLAPMAWAARPLPPPAEASLAVYQKNLLFTLADPAPVVADILASGAGIVLLQEVSDRNLAVTEALRGALPHQVVCARHAVGGVAVLSRWPFLDAPVCDAGPGLAAVRIDAPGGPVTAAALHLHWPWPFGQAAHVDRLLPALAALPRPVIVGGDFNAVPSSVSVRRIAAATGTRRAGPLRPSFVLHGVLPVTIDHVLVPAGSRAVSSPRPRLGSDHRGQLVRVERPR